jgi:crotonobetainyl-CoA:carnitine CoA-transferase CaiB-like acyl-CoA transferase
LGYPISDAVGGLFGAIGVLAALYKLKADPSSAGQEIDCSITEAMLRVLEFSAIEYDQLGVARGRSGNTSQYAAPGNIYRTADGAHASIAASTQSIFVRLCQALRLPELLSDERFATNAQRVKSRESLDNIIAAASLCSRSAPLVVVLCTSSAPPSTRRPAASSVEASHPTAAKAM